MKITKTYMTKYTVSLIIMIALLIFSCFKPTETTLPPPTPPKEYNYYYIQITDERIGPIVLNPIGIDALQEKFEFGGFENELTDNQVFQYYDAKNEELFIIFTK